MSNRYIFEEQTVLSFLEEEPSGQFSEYVRLLKEVPVSHQSHSSVAQLLSVRGHYTCFAPNDEAIRDYLDSLYAQGLITEPSWDGFQEQRTLDSIRKVIVYNSIIDGGNSLIFSTSDFPANDGEEFELPNLNDRRMSVSRGAVNSDSIFINEQAPVDLKMRDIEVSNGCIHMVRAVICPSNETLADMAGNWSRGSKSGYTVMSRLLLACGLADTLSKVRDEVWEKLYATGVVKNLGLHPTEGTSGAGFLPPHRKYGFTIFAETDDCWERLLAEAGQPKRAEDIGVQEVKQYLQRIGAYADALKDDDFTNEDNIINQFVTYHVLPVALSRDKLVLHWNERGYNYKNASNYTIPVMEYYQTLGRHRLLKIFQSAESFRQSTNSDGIFLNRFPILRNGRGEFGPLQQNINDYHESGRFYPASTGALSPDENEGVEIMRSPAYIAANGYVYPLERLLVCTENVCIQQQRQRIRFDAAAMFPEFMNNNLRGLKARYTELGKNRGFPTNYKYIEGIDIYEGTQFYYLPGRGDAWQSYQGDEFNIIGNYEFIIKLPTVPRAGHYEIRYGWNANNTRSMCQIYWGEDKNNLIAMGIPHDLRIGGLNHYFPSGNLPSIVGWESDTEDPTYNDEVDRRMRNNGYMKAPNSYTSAYGTIITCRSQPDVLRKIIVSADMIPEKTYYLKFKSVLDNEKKQCNLDYLEFCAKEVFANPEETEDIW